MKTIFLVLPCYNEELIIEDSAKKLQNLMERLMNQEKISSLSRVIFVNDGSKDSTWSLLTKICENNKLFGAISLAHNSGHQNALLAGMMTVKDMCDAVITLDADLQHDIETIPEFISKFEAGNEIVYGVRKSRNGEGLIKKVTGNAFYKIMSFLGAKIIKNHADYRLLSAKALEALSHYHESNLFLRGIIPQIGFKSTIIEYEEKERMAGDSKYSMGKMMRLATDGITSFSVRSLQMITICGFMFFVISLIMFVYAVITYCRAGTVPGWTSIVAPIWLLGGVQLLALGIVGEYIGKIYVESKQRPRYEVEERIL